MPSAQRLDLTRGRTGLSKHGGEEDAGSVPRVKLRSRWRKRFAENDPEQVVELAVSEGTPVAEREQSDRAGVGVVQVVRELDSGDCGGGA